MQVDHVAAPVALLRMLTGYWVSKALNVAAELGLADLLADGAHTSDELAAACGADPSALYRLLRALASVGVFTEAEGRRFALTPLAELLRSDVPGSMRALARMYGLEQYRAWGDLLEGVRSGEPVFNHVFGTSYFDYLEHNSAAGALFDEAMTAQSTLVAAAVVAAYDFADIDSIVDVGGGHGLLLATILRAHPKMRGVVFDRPQVVAGAPALLEAHSIADRCTTAGGDFFRSVPAGGDAYIINAVLHNWDDERSRLILENCRGAMRPTGKLLVIGHVLPPGDEPSFGKWLDLHMLVLQTGRERTEAEYRALLGAAGFEVTRVVPTRSAASLVQAVRA